MGKLVGLIASLFGYLLNFIYGLVNNYGLAIILFTIAVQIILLPLSIKQQKTLIKNNKIQEKLKDLKEKYKNDQVRLGQETMDLYKREKVSPFGGCLGSLFQLLVIISIFYMVRQPLTYMERFDENKLDEYVEKYHISAQSNYKEIDIIREAQKSGDDSIHLEMNFLGIDLSNIPSRNWGDWTVYIIPGLYVISSIISMKITTAQNKKKLSKEEEEEKQRKEAEKKVVTGGGAVAATASVTNLKATKSGVDMFASTGKISRGMSTVTNTTKTASNVAKQTKSLWAKVGENARWAKDAILNWGTKFRNMKMIKPLVESRAFRGCAGFLGYGFGAVTLISGLSDITKVASDTVQKFDK